MKAASDDGGGIPLGPFELLRPVGKGGMGVVWLGRHREMGVPVAVKVITGKQAASDEFHQAFVQEVRAVSALDHPAIVWIFDCGEIPAATAAASRGELIAGSPFLVMEYASRGTLRSVEEELDWPRIRSVLMALLDALAHAHARGVLHRDLKPDNVLIAGPDDLRPGFKITDFGIARPLDEEEGRTEEQPVGTPQYMAPEQIRNAIDQYGPHTDLYAFGGLAWKLVTGKVPFQAFKGASLMFAHLRKPPPEFQPRVEVPEGLEAFLRILLAKDPRDRFQRASDAAVALAMLDEARGPEVSIEPFPLQGPTSGPLELDTSTLKVVLSSNRASAAEVTPRLRPPLPETWRLPPTHSAPLRLMGAGLGLFGLRPVPFVGREAERDRLWSSLAEVHRSGRARAIVVRGSAGVGRSRLVQWIAGRAHEVGGANVLDTRIVGSDALEHVRRPLVRFLRAHPLPPELRDERFGELLAGLSLDRIDVADAVEMLLEPERLELSAVQRYAIVRRVWQILAQDRPLVVLFDDAHVAPEVMKLVRLVLDAQAARASPILMVLTLLDEELGPTTGAGRALSTLHERPDVVRVDVGPLRGRHRLELVQELLGLDRELSDRVAERTAGSPLFAVQLVSDWVQRQVLRPGAAGFVLERADAELPATLDDVWETRIREVATGMEAPALQLLERAAVLGREVDAFEWQAVGDDPDGQHAALGATYFNPRLARLRQALMDRLLARRLAEGSERGFVFTHAQFREALIRRARDVGRLRGHAAACAAVLVHRSTDPDTFRVAELWLLAGRPMDAVPLLLRAEAFQRRSSGPARASETLQLCERVLKAAKVPRADRLWAEVAWRRAELAQEAGQATAAIQAAELAHRLALAGGWEDLDAGAQIVLGSAARARGDDVGAERHWLAAVQLLGEDGDVRATVNAWHWLRRLAANRGDRAEAKRRGERVLVALDRARTPEERGAGLLALGEHHLWLGQLDEATAAAQQAADLASTRRDLTANAKAHSLLAEIAERRGTLAVARDEWMLTVDLLEDLGHPRAGLARCRWAVVEARTGRFSAARQAVEPVVLRGEPEEPRLRVSAHGCLAISAAGRGRMDLADQELQLAIEAWSGLVAHEPQVARLFVLLGEVFAAGGAPERARRAWLLARERLVASGDREGAAAVVKRLEALSASDRA